MLRRDTEYVLTWNAAAHTWDARPIRRDGMRIVDLETSGPMIGMPPLLAESTSTTWND